MSSISEFRLPNLFLPGAAKSGTSSIHELLDAHPEINMSTNKEPHFLASKKLEEYSTEEINAYQGLFNFKKQFKYHGESSTGYFYFQNFKANLKTHFKTEPKFIFILRNPIDRTYSHFTYVKSLGSEDADLRAAVLENHQQNPEPEDMLPEHIIKNYHQYSLYGKWLEKFYIEFDPKNIKLLLFEDFKEHPLETLNECFRFLNLSEMNEIPLLHSNKTVQTKYPKTFRKLRILTLNKNRFTDIVKHFFPKKFRRKYKKRISEVFLIATKTNKTFPKLNENDRKWLYDLYKEDIAKLKTLTGLSFSKWKDFD